MSKIIFANNIRYLLKKNKLTPAQLAHQMQVPTARVYAWTAGKAYPRTDQLRDLCDAMNCHSQLYQLITIRLQQSKTNATPKPPKLPAHAKHALNNIINQATELLNTK